MDDYDEVMRLSRIREISLEQVSERLRDDKMIVKSILRYRGIDLKHVSERLRDDYGVIMIAAISDYRSLQYASEDFRFDSDIVKEVIRCNHDWRILGYVDESIGDMDLMIEILEKDHLIVNLCHLGF